jgi:hypothetical protein
VKSIHVFLLGVIKALDRKLSIFIHGLPVAAATFDECSLVRLRRMDGGTRRHRKDWANGGGGRALATAGRSPNGPFLGLAPHRMGRTTLCLIALGHHARCKAVLGRAPCTVPTGPFCPALSFFCAQCRQTRPWAGKG